MAPEEAIKTVQMILTPSQGRPLPSVHLENVSLGLLLTPTHVRLASSCSGVHFLQNDAGYKGSCVLPSERLMTGMLHANSAIPSVMLAAQAACAANPSGIFMHSHWCWCAGAGPGQCDCCDDGRAL